MRAETLQCVDGPLDGRCKTVHEGDKIVYKDARGEWTYEKRRREGRDVWLLTGLHVHFTHSRPAFTPRLWYDRRYKGKAIS